VNKLKAYTAPKLETYGRARELTLGNSGNNPDFIVVGGVPLVNITNPTCAIPGSPPGLACFTTVP
jgi:hypothetical protein